MTESPEKHPEDVDPHKEYPVSISFRMASFILNCTSFLVNNSRGEMQDTLQSFELAMNDLRTMGPEKYNSMMDKVVEILRKDPDWEQNLQVFKGEEQPPISNPEKKSAPIVIVRGSKLIQ